MCLCVSNKRVSVLFKGNRLQQQQQQQPHKINWRFNNTTEAQHQRVQRRDSRLCCATAEFFAARERTQQLIARLERTLKAEQSAAAAAAVATTATKASTSSRAKSAPAAAPCSSSASCERPPAAQQTLQVFLREATAKWIRCLRGSDQFNSLDDPPPPSNAGHEVGQGDSQRAARTPDVGGGGSLCEPTFAVRKPFVLNAAKPKLNHVKRNIRDSQATRIRSCMRLPQMTAEEQQQIDEILRGGELAEMRTVAAEAEAEAESFVNPFTLRAAERERLRELNIGLHVEERSSEAGGGTSWSRVCMAGGTEPAAADVEPTIDELMAELGDGDDGEGGGCFQSFRPQINGNRVVRFADDGMIGDQMEKKTSNTAALDAMHADLVSSFKSLDVARLSKY